MHPAPGHSPAASPPHDSDSFIYSHRTVIHRPAAAVNPARNPTTGLVADTANDRVRVVAAHTGTYYGRPMTAGDIYTVAGGGTSAPTNGGPATQAKLQELTR